MQWYFPYFLYGCIFDCLSPPPIISFVPVYLPPTYRIISEMPLRQALAREKFISEIIQLNEAAHESDYRAMGIAWAASGRQKCPCRNIQTGNSGKKEILTGKCLVKMHDTAVKSYWTAKKRHRNKTVIIWQLDKEGCLFLLRCNFQYNLLRRRRSAPRNFVYCFHMSFLAERAQPRIGFS